MNCLDYRRQLLAGTGESEAMRVHRLGCAACTTEWAQHGAFEEALRGALQVRVPEGFVERMARAQALRRRRFLAAAAGTLLAAGVGGYAWLARQDPLAMACIDFVMKEEAKSIMMGPMADAEARRMLSGTLPLGAIERVGQVKHVGPCPFYGRSAYHVVLMVPQGKVTLLVMPGYRMEGRRRAAKEGMSAAVMASGDGSVGIVGTDMALVDSVMGALKA
jgi:hypothetical protein